MRKIEQEMIGAVHQLLGKPNQYRRVGANTEVSTNNNGAVSVDLHGNQIASVTWSASGQCFLFSIYSNGCLWHSRTTFSRVNALACHLIGESVLYSKRGEKMLARKRTNTTKNDRVWDQIDHYSWSINQWQAI
jgi:hypothetical protein